ncbi:MAG: hypothetical protein GXO91_06265 [FCB group bacterium]|nr:hypothetical protein [FCB group bacterium]
MTIRLLTSIILLCGAVAVLPGCHDSAITNQEETNEAPLINYITLYNTIHFSNLLDYGTAYNFICDADDPEGDTLTYQWIFSYRSYQPFIWQAYQDTAATDSNIASWTTNAVGDLSITCTVEDSRGAVSVWTKEYVVSPPEALSSHDWKLVGVLGFADSLDYPAEDDYLLNIEPDAYYGTVGPCSYHFGQISLFENTLTFSTLFDEPRPNTCPDDSSVVNLSWDYLNFLPYRYEINNDTLNFYLSNDTTGIIFYMFEPI